MREDELPREQSHRFLLLIYVGCILPPVLLVAFGCGSGTPPPPVDVRQFKPWKTFTTEVYPQILAFSRDGKRFFGVPDSWNLETGDLAKGRRHGFEGRGTAYDPENEVYAFIGVLKRHPKRNYVPVLMDVAKPEEPLRTVGDVPKNAMVIAFSQRGGYLAAVLEDGGLAVWSVGRSFGGVVEGSAWVYDGDFREPLVFSPDGSKLACRNARDEVVVINRSARVLHTFPCKDARRLAFSPDNRNFAVGRPGRIVTIYDLEQKREKATIDFAPGVAMEDRGDSAGDFMLFTPDGQFLVLQGYGGEVCFWDPHEGKQIHIIPPPHKSGVDRVAFSEDGRTLAAYAFMEKKIYLWRIEP